MTTLKQISEELKSRILYIMDDENYMEITGSDWKAIGHNLVSNYSEDDITDEVIISEIENYYNA